MSSLKILARSLENVRAAMSPSAVRSEARVRRMVVLPVCRGACSTK
ncbi:hypothetical protein ACFLIM_36275 [Nonomuraea sp. M3C6]|uniref:Uncharacterized protein n=1 Tax=Nonomuraea marmarensis TaxID=3351344 RepID=A0ABW7ARC7_9ACTN